MNKTFLRLLLVEDSELDASLILQRLEQGGFAVQCERIETAPQMRLALESSAWDLVIADYALPCFDAPAALALLQQTGHDIPFLVVSGFVGEEIAVAMMKAGAKDYLMKDNLLRLAPAVARELQEAKSRREREQAETALRESERRFRQMLGNMRLIAMMLDAEGRVLFANPFLLALTGWTLPEAIGQDWFEMFLPSDQSREVKQVYQSLLQSTPVPHHVNDIITRSGERRLIAWNNTELKDTTGRNIGVACIGEDITESRKAEEALRKSEETFRSIYANAPVGIYQSTVDRLLGVNPVLATMFGYQSPEEMVAASAHATTFFVDPDERREVLREAAESKSYIRREVRYRRKDGSVFTANLSMRGVRDASGQVAFVEGFVEDVTERKQAEEARARLSEQMRLLLDSTGDGIYGIDLNGRCTFINQAAAQATGWQPRELEGQHMHEILHHHRQDGSLYPEHECPIFRAISAGARCRFDTDVFWRRDGTSFPVEYSSYPIVEKGILTGAVVAFSDITERKKLEHEVALRERRLNAFFRGATAGLVLLDRDLRYVQINDTLAEMNGLPAEEHLGRTVREVVPKLAPVVEPVLERVLRTSHAVLNQEITGETRGSSGMQRHWMGSFFPVAGPDGKTEGIGAIVVEITELKRAETKLRESEEKFRQLAENIDRVFWICDREKTEILYVSPAYERIWGRACQSLYEHPMTFTDAIHPEDRDRVLAALERERLGEEYEEEYRIVRPDGAVRWIHDRGFVVRNERGEFYRLAGLAEDITERRQLEEEFRQAQKMEAVGQLAGGVAHDFNNILTATLMHLGLLQQRAQLPVDIKEVLGELEGEATRAANLTRQLLLFSRRQMPSLERLNMNEVVQNLLKMVRRLIGENIEIDFSASGAASWVRADAGMVEQVVMNLCVNARDAMPKGGRLAISTQVIQLDSQTAKTHPNARPGSFVCLEVNDTGCGMAEPVLKRIFEPFFTTKEAGKGTGLGLATVYGIVRQHEGWIEVASEVGKGSSFRVYLPAQAQASQTEVKSESLEEIKGGSETILLVEDELSLRRSAALCLRKLGYGVLEASNPTQALRIWERHRESIALLLTDQVMPGQMTGWELGELLRKQQPNLKVILSSGYSDQLGRFHVAAGEAFAFLAKPYKAAPLAKLVRRCLDGHPHPANQKVREE